MGMEGVEQDRKKLQLGIIYSDLINCFRCNSRNNIYNVEWKKVKIYS